MNPRCLLTILLLLLWCTEFAQTATISGRVVDASTGEVVPWVQISLQELHRTAIARADGTFRFSNVPLGSFTLTASRIGFSRTVQAVTVSSDDSLGISVQLEATALRAPVIVVEASRRIEETFAGQRAIDLTGRRLNALLGRTVAETLDREPGISQRTMGPAPARPVLRGLSGNRLLVLEDGERTGDLSATAADHAVAIEPIGSETIEVIRGPAALMYGSNTIGGVVNVERQMLPRSLPEDFNAQFVLQGESVNDGGVASARVSLPLNRFSLHGSGSLRSGRDIRTPEGRLRNTSITTLDGSAGASLITSWGYWGVAGSWYESDYGIPGGFLGGHPNGVDIELERRSVETRFDTHPEGTVVDQIELEGRFNRYYHREIESSGICGVSFGVLSYHVNGRVHLTQRRFLQHSVIGVRGGYRDFASGCLTFVPQTIEKSVAGYFYNEWQAGGIDIKGTFRTDYHYIRPFGRESNNAGIIRSRSFAGWSTALSVGHPIVTGLRVEATGMRTFNAPGVEELYSDGPHLAAYSYEVGNAQIGSEAGVGIDLTLYVEQAGVQGSFSAFVNDFERYIFPENTGRINYGAGEEGQLYIYQYQGLPARMWGVEVLLSATVAKGISVVGTISYVEGTLTDRNSPIPFIPPLNGKIELHYRNGRIEAVPKVHFAAAQTRLGEFEEQTAGYLIADLTLQYDLITGGILNSLVLAVENIADTTHRKHLSRVKSIMPEPARNFKLLYRIFL